MTRNCKTIEEFKFELLILNSTLQNTEEFLIHKKIQEDNNVQQWWEICRFAPCEECTNVECPRYYDNSKC